MTKSAATLSFEFSSMEVIIEFLYIGNCYKIMIFDSFRKVMW